MTRDAEAVFESEVIRDDFLSTILEDFSIVDAVVMANDKESIFDN